MSTFTILLAYQRVSSNLKPFLWGAFVWYEPRYLLGPAFHGATACEAELPSLSPHPLTLRRACEPLRRGAPQTDVPFQRRDPRV